MNAYYILSVVGSRILGLSAVVVLSYLLSPSDFGIFALIITNALLMHLLFSSWISNSSWKDVSTGEGRNQEVIISNSLGYAAALSSVPLCISAVLFLVDFERFYYVIITLVFAVTILFYDLILIIKNAQGSSRDHSATSLLRGVLTFVFSVSLTVLGFGLRGAVLGQILGTALTVVCRRSFWMMWRHIDLSLISGRGVAAKLRFGLVSAFALNLYLMANALCRNLVLLHLGEAEAGYFSLSADMFYAPIAVFAMALSLSSIPELYRSAGNDAESSQAADFIGAVLAVSIPYALAGLFLGSAVAHLFLGPAMSAHISQIAPHSIIHAACFCVLSTQTTIALTQGRLKIAVGLPIITLAVLAGVLLGSFVLDPGGISLLRYAEAVTAALLPITIAILCASRAVLRVSIPWAECLRVFGASLAMCLVLAALARFPLPYPPLPAIVLGGATFVGAAWLLGSRIVRNLVRLSLA